MTCLEPGLLFDPLCIVTAGIPFQGSGTTRGAETSNKKFMTR